MQFSVSLKLKPQEAESEQYRRLAVAKQLNVNESRIKFIRITKKSIDARHRDLFINISLQVFVDEMPDKPIAEKPEYKNVSNKESVIVVGAGPAGLFATLRLIELGVKPILLERGKDVSERKKDVAAISREHKVDEDSNYCFGEGGAGTFSDGKLYTRSNKRGNIQKIYDILYTHGANESILYEAHPHIGTDLLPEVVKNIRQTILEHGGEIHFQTKVTGLIIDNTKVNGVLTSNGDKIFSKAVILATGHSARDVYKFLYASSVALESKQFAIGVRVEHPQAQIDNIQYHGQAHGEFLPSASYSLVEQVNNRGVFSFCMCPGGFMVPSATQQNQVVVNGMSASKRNSPYANSGVVTEIRPEDLGQYSEQGVLAGIYFQEALENMAWQNGGRSQTAPAQRLGDFVKGRMSSSLPKMSYFPGAISSPVHMWLPDFVSEPLREGFKKFDQKLRGFLTNEAVVLAVESRTSSPIRIPRVRETFRHIHMEGLYVCGEGSGYAGGITSSAMDGENCADQVATLIKNQ